MTLRAEVSFGVETSKTAVYFHRLVPLEGLVEEVRVREESSEL